MTSSSLLKEEMELILNSMDWPTCIEVLERNQKKIVERLQEMKTLSNFEEIAIIDMLREAENHLKHDNKEATQLRLRLVLELLVQKDTL